MAKNHNPIIDIHCHPAIKPFGQSFPGNINSSDRRKVTSLWYSQKPSFLTRLLNVTTSLTRFTQTDFTTLTKGRVPLVIISLSPIEREFFQPVSGDGLVTDLAVNAITNISRPKIDFIQENKNYYKELKAEYTFYQNLHNKTVKIGRKTWKYRLVSNYNEIADNLKKKAQGIVSVVASIEGLHTFNEDNSNFPVPDGIFEKIREVKAWKYPPLFISPAHHFRNNMCGHAYSLSPLLRKLMTQSDGVNEGFSEIGRKAVEHLLDKNSGRRILIDIKHMSRKARREYYQMLKKPEYADVPVIVSHGAVNGRPTVYSDESHGDSNGPFQGEDINIYDDEIIILAKSGGLFGIQVDERRLISKEYKKTHRSVWPWRQYRYGAGYLWNQVEHIAKLLDNAGLKAWDNICLGSDFDGMVNPVDGFWTAAEYPRLRRYFRWQAKCFLQSYNFKVPENNLSPDMITNKFFGGNVLRFLKQNF